jgi:prevent-host-death family protein
MARGQTQTDWQLQDAKARFSEVFRKARSQGPQRITRHGKEAVVVIPAEQFEQLTRRTRQPRSLVEFFARSPLASAGLDLERKPDYGRTVGL